MHAVIEEAHAALSHSTYPKLLFVGDPRRISLAGIRRKLCEESQALQSPIPWAGALITCRRIIRKVGWPGFEPGTPTDSKTVVAPDCFAWTNSGQISDASAARIRELGVGRILYHCGGGRPRRDASHLNFAFAFFLFLAESCAQQLYCALASLRLFGRPRNGLNATVLPFFPCRKNLPIC